MVAKYSDAGVDTDAANTLVKRIAPFCAKTRRAEVIPSQNGFAGLFSMPDGYRDAVFVSSTDGVGTKLKIACAMRSHATIGRDLVAMSVNDILVCGAEPLWFLDYFACGRLNVDVAATVIEGIAEACRDAGCALLGGETAEMPDMYAPQEYDLAGFAVGVAERDALLGAQRVRRDDVILGVASSGLHSNGFSLVRRLIDEAKLAWDASAPWCEDATVAAQLLTPTIVYAAMARAAQAQGGARAMAHITGGGLTENLPRVLRADQDAIIRRDAWPRPAVFDWLQSTGGISDDEMLRVFNCGVGMAIIVDADAAQATIDAIQAGGLEAWRIGRVVAGEQRVRYE